MRTKSTWLARAALRLLLGAALTSGCAGSDRDTDELGSSASVDAPAALGEQGQSLTTVDQVDCSICAIARECCHQVYAANGLASSASSCDNFDARRCAALDPGRQRTTKLNCLVQLRTTISAWWLAGRTPPSACRIPGE